MISQACPCCDAEARSHWAHEASFDVVRCMECGLLYVYPMPDSNSIEIAVRSGFQTLGPSVINVRSRRIARKVDHYRKVMSDLMSDVIAKGVPVTWVDVGCGYGEFLEAMQDILPLGSKVIGIEPMTHKAEAARDRGLEVINEYLKPHQFEADFVSNMDVFSHIPDYRSFLKTVITNLKSTGEMVIETGNAADLSTRNQAPNELGLPDHLVFAGRQTLGRYLASVDLRVKESREYRFDTFFQMAKNLVKFAIGRPSYVGIPYRSPYRQLILRTERV